MLKTARLILVTALTAAACAGSTSGPTNTGITKEKFVTVMVELAGAEPEQRAAVLQKHRTSDKQLQAFIRAHEDYPATLSTAFDSIQAALDRKRLQAQ